MADFSKEVFEEFFQVFAKSVKATLERNLDEDTCNNISLDFNNFSEFRSVNEQKNNSAVYKIDYVVGQKQGRVAILVQEDLIAAISDILTGGEGTDVYKGSLSEIETNSVKKIVTDIFNDLENSFKGAYDETLVFGTSFTLTLKEVPEYLSCLDGSGFNFVADAELSLTGESKFAIKLLFNMSFLESLMQDLGYSESGGSTRKRERTKVELDCLSNIDIDITAELGRTQVPIKYALELTEGSVVELDTQNNADIKIFANGLEFAYAQIVAVDENFGIKITKIISPEERLEELK